MLSDRGFRVEVFDASRVADGPVATLSAPAGTTVPLQLHAAWMAPRAGPDLDHERLDFVGDLNPDAVAALTPELRRAVHEVAGSADRVDAGQR